MTLRLTEQEARGLGFLKDGGRKTNKYGVAPKAKRTVDGIVFASKKEADYYCLLKSMREAGLVRFFLRQVPFHLPGNVKYLLDFLVVQRDGTNEYVDAKGYRTPQYKDKKKIVEDLFKIEIREV